MSSTGTPQLVEGLRDRHRLLGPVHQVGTGGVPPQEMSPQIPPDEPGAADEPGTAAPTNTVAAAVTATVAAATVARLRKAARATDDLFT